MLSRSVVVAAVVGALAFTGVVAPAGAAAVATARDAALPAPRPAAPAGFTDTALFTASSPTALAFTPDGRMLITQDGGQLRVARGTRLNPRPAIDLSARLCSNGERGLLGVAVDPAFATNKWIYLYWTFNRRNSCASGGEPTTPVNRVARYTLSDSDVIAPTSEKVIVDNIPSVASNHNGGGLAFGKEGLLHIGVGDSGCQVGAPTQCADRNRNSRRLDLPNGKILRVTRGGTIPAGNPFAKAAGARHCTAPSGVPTGTGPCAETFAWGLRNPFRFAFRATPTALWVNDVGQNAWEEIDRVQAGKDYGWNIREGFCATGSTTDCGPTTYTNPIYAYGRSAGCVAITAAAFVPAGAFPAAMNGRYLFGDFGCDTIFELVPKAGGTFQARPFLTAKSPVDMAFGPNGSGQALYYLEYTGAVHRVAYVAPGARGLTRAV